MNYSSVPIYDEFNWVTNFTNLSSYDNVSNAFIGIAGVGLINFSENISVGGINLNDAVNISHNRIEVDGSFMGINKPAILTLHNLSYDHAPLPMKDSTVCTSCAVIDYIGDTFWFNVTGFSVYTTEANSQIAVDYTSGKLIPGQTVQFNATYTNRTDGSAVVGATCSFNGTFPMNEISPGIYNFSRTFPNKGVKSYDQNFSISCSQAFFEEAIHNGSVTIQLNATLLTEVMDLEGVWLQGGIVLSDLNNDDYLDLIIGGSNNSRITKVYTNQNKSYIYNLSIGGGIQFGCLGVIDYNNDGMLDISIMGDEEIAPVIYDRTSKLYKK